MAHNSEATYLGSAFAPGEFDVIVGRGKVCYKHSGNLRLACIVQSVLGTYAASEATKKSKTELIKSLVTQIRESSPSGGFVKFDSEKGEWFEVGDRTAREKVSQAFRDALTDHYKSSSTSKTLKRRQERITRQTSNDSGEAEPVTPGGTLYSDPVSSLPFGSMSLASPSPHSRLATHTQSPHRSFTMPSPRSNFHLPSPSPRANSMTMTGLASPSPRGHMGNLVSPLSASFSTSPAHPLSSRFSTSPSPLTMSLAAQNAGLAGMGESPSSIRLAMAIAERKRRLTNLNMIMAVRRANNGGGGQSMGGLGRPQVPQF